MVGVPALERRFGPARRRGLAAFLLAALLAGAGLVAPPSPVVAVAEPAEYFPMIYVTPQCLRGGETTVHIHGRNFMPNTAVEVWDLYNTTDFLYGNYTPASTNAYGTFEADVQIDAHVTGHHRIVAPYAGTYSLQAPTLHVGNCDARISISPKCRDGGGPTDVGIAGTGFESSGPAINIELRADDYYTVLDSMTIDPTDTFNVNFSFDEYSNGLPNGFYYVTAYQTPADSVFDAWGDDAYLTVPCPTVTLNPTCTATSGAPPDTWSIEVTTAGWPEDRIEIVFDPGGQPQEFISWAANGTVLITPYRRPSGDYTVLVKQGYDAGTYYVTVNSVVFVPAWTGHQLQAVSTTFAKPCPPPTAPPTSTPTPSPTPTAEPGATTLAANPACGPPQLLNDVVLFNNVSVTGTGFLPGKVTLTFDPGGINQQTFDALALGDGTFTSSLPIRAGPDGVFTIVAHQDALVAVIPDASTSFTVPCVPPLPVVVADVPCGDALAAMPAAYSINLHGTGFLPGRVELTFDAGGLAPEPQLPAIADSTGAFATTITPTGRGPGSFLIGAHQQVTGSLLAVDASVPFVVACTSASFSITPGSARRSFVIVVTGLDFPPDADLLLRWSRGIGATAPAVVRTDANGVFTRQILIFNSDFTGPRQMTVELATDALALAAIPPVDFQVLAGTISPPFALSDNPYAQPDSTIVFRR